MAIAHWRDKALHIAERPEPHDRWHEWLWLLLVAATPILINPWGLQVFDLPKIVLVRTVVITIAALSLWQGGIAQWLASRQMRRISWSDPRFWAAILAVVWVVATLTSLDVGLSLWGTSNHQEGLYTTLTYLVLFGVVSTRLRRQAQAQRLLLGVAFGTLPIITYGLIQWAGTDPVVWYTDDKSLVLSTLGRSNFVGSYLVMSIPLCIGAILLVRHAWLRAALALEVGAALTLLWLTGARSAWLAAVVVLVMTLGWVAVRKIGWRRLRAWLALIGLALLVFSATGLATLANRGLGLLSYSSRLPELPDSLIARLLIWQASLRLVAERPILGFGPDNFVLAFHKVLPPELIFYQGRTLTDRAHNMFLDQAISAGILGVIAYVGLICSILVMLVKALLSWRGSRSVMLAVLLAGMFGHLVDLLFTFEVASTAVLFWVAAAAGVGLAQERSEDHSLTTVPGLAVREGLRGSLRRLALALLAAATFTVIVATNMLLLIADTHAGWAARPGWPLSKRLEYAQNAVELWPREPSYWTALGWLHLYRARGEEEPLPSLEAAERNMVAAVERRPLEPLGWAALADVRGYWAIRMEDPGALAAAEAAYSQAIELAPTTSPLHGAYGALEFLVGDYERAMMKLERAIALDPTDGGAWGYLAQVYAALGRSEQANWASLNAERYRAPIPPDQK